MSFKMYLCIFEEKKIFNAHCALLRGSRGYLFVKLLLNLQPANKSLLAHGFSARYDSKIVYQTDLWSKRGLINFHDFLYKIMREMIQDEIITDKGWKLFIYKHCINILEYF